MAIKSINIGSFTVFRDYEMKFSSGVNILNGKNGVGKTHMLKLLYTGVSKDAYAQFDSAHKTDGTGIAGYHVVSEIGAGAFGVERAELDNNNLYWMDFEEENFSANQAVYIPPKDILSHARGLPAMKKKYGSNMPFEAPLIDIIEASQAWNLNEPSPLAKEIASALEAVMDGTVEVKDDGSFWIKKRNGRLIPFSMEAEGVKKFGLLWKLLMNEGIKENSIVLWDEPENGVHPEVFPVLVNAVLALQRQSVQFIIATHSYNFVRYFDVLKKENDKVCHYILFKDENGYTKYSQADDFVGLTPNPIDDAGEQLYKDVISRAIRGV